MGHYQDSERWWRRAACAGRDPAWWSAEDRPRWPDAVRLCLACPVRERCLEDAVRQGDNGVIRGGMLLVGSARGPNQVSLICANCGLRPVRVTESGGVPQYCGRTCQLASHRRARAGSPVRRPAGPRPPGRLEASWEEDLPRHRRRPTGATPPAATPPAAATSPPAAMPPAPAMHPAPVTPPAPEPAPGQRQAPPRSSPAAR